MEPFETLDKRFAPYTIPIVLLEKLHRSLHAIDVRTRGAQAL
jgi:hypothetical protein